MLQTWNAFSLVERTKLIEMQWNLKISNHTLWQFYLQNNIRLRTGMAVYRQEMRRTAEIVEKRNVFAKLLASLVAANKPIIYVDETTFNTWMLKAKSWSKKD